ncbi:ATP-binding protein [Nonomuraea sp. H19]|uniref:ATP-binding protein n=1 Tax=Nonomuraea sp. H19 TaxID=3452206 RepID=UPI003F8BE1DC
MRFGVLGPLAVWTADGRHLRVPEAKVRLLLAALLARRGRTVPADRLIDDLWGERLPAKPAAVLHTKVSQLRRALEDAEPGGRDLVTSEPAGFAVRVGPDAVDAGDFAALVARAYGTEDPRERATLLTDALALWRGQAFADFSDLEFARAPAARLEEERLVALEHLAEARLDLGDHSLLTAELGDLVTRHPLRERLRAAHVRALYGAGRQAEALASYRELRDLLDAELGVEPAPELAALHQAVLRQDPALRAAPPAALRQAVHGQGRTPEAAGRSRTNLPAPRTELIGRDEAVVRTSSLLAQARLVTLTGPGGVGKTRLAVEAAGQALGDVPDGVWLVELGALERSARETELAETIARAIGLRDDGNGPADQAERLVSALRDKRALVLLDGCEHVVEPVAALCDRLLKAAPGLRILATSREPLELSGEALLPVPPLDLPAPGAGVAGLEASGAVRLFVTRAAATAPGFALDAGNAEAIEAICRRLDGIPLALELAAAKVRTLGVHELENRLDDRFRLLAGRQRDVPARQRTLRAVIDWSWSLLTEPERVLLRRLAVHVGGCTLESVERACAGDGVAAADLADLLGRLVDRSLVVMADDGGTPRYRLLESIAAYCLERLGEAGELDLVRRRHRDHYTGLAERAEPRLRGHDQRLWLRRLDAEAANLRAALDGAIHDGAGDAAIRLANSLAWYWVLTGRLGEGRCALTAALEADDAATFEARATAETWRTGLAMLAGTGPQPQDERAGQPAEAGNGAASGGAASAMAGWLRAHASIDFGDLAAVEAGVRQALTEFRAAGDRWGVAAALMSRAKHALVRGDLATLERDGSRSLEMFRDVGDRWGQIQAANLLGTLAEITGDYDRAMRLRRDGLRMAEELGLWSEMSYRLSALGRTALLMGDHAAAGEFHLRALEQAAQQSNTLAQELAEIGLALGARRQGRLDEAEARLRTWLDWNRQIAPDNGTALILAELGFIAEQRGDARAAMALHEEGHAAARATGDPRAIALALEGLAGAHALAGRHQRAAWLLGTAAAARASAGAPLPPAERGDVDRITAAVRRALGEELFASESAAGAAQPVE